MQVVNVQLISNKKVLLRYDIDVALSETGYQKPDIKVKEDFKLKAGLDTLKLCLENASKVIIIGHVGRPFATAEDEKNGPPAELSAQPIFEWFKLHLPGSEGRVSSGDPGESTSKESRPTFEVDTGMEFATTLEEAQNSQNKLILLENIRFFHGEVPGAEYHASCESKICDIDFAKKLASLGEVYINEAFSSHNKAASTTMVPTLLPHAAGLHFAEEVRVLREVRDNPKKPFIAIMGGAKVKDKLPVINVLAQKADAVLVGGKLVHEIREQGVSLPENVMVGKLNEDGFDISSDTTLSWADLINKAALIVWNGPLGKFEDPKYNQTQKVTEMVLDCGAEVVIGGGDSVASLNQYGLLEKAQQKGFVSVGGGAMLKFLANGTLPTIEVLK